MRHRGRISIVGAAVAAGAFATAALITPAAVVAKAKTTTVKCKYKVSTAAPSGSPDLLPGAANGEQWGSIHCSKPVGGGVRKDDFKTNPSSGNEKGKFTEYFSNGTIRGSFLLIPQEGSLGNLYSPTFGASAFLGKVKVTGGTGAFAAAAGKGTSMCVSNDGVHFKCVDKLDLTSL
jgi:hypothetical protein